MWSGFGVVLWYLHRKIRLTELFVELSWVWQYITEQISISNALKTILNQYKFSSPSSVLG